MAESPNKKTTNFRFQGVEWIFINLPFVCYLAILGCAYIYNAHNVERKLRHIDRLNKEVKDVRWRALDLKQSVMYGSTQSQIMEGMRSDELKPIEKVPYVISANME